MILRKESFLPQEQVLKEDSQWKQLNLFDFQLKYLLIIEDR